jgi:hypothetical protein
VRNRTFWKNSASSEIEENCTINISAVGGGGTGNCWELCPHTKKMVTGTLDEFSPYQRAALKRKQLEQLTGVICSSFNFLDDSLINYLISTYVVWHIP